MRRKRSKSNALEYNHWRIAITRRLDEHRTVAPAEPARARPSGRAQPRCGAAARSAACLAPRHQPARAVTSPASSPRPTPSVAAQLTFFVAAALVMLGNYYVYDSIAPVAELLTQQLHFSDGQIGTLNAIYSAPNIVLVLVGGILTDRFGARAMVLATTAICLVGALLTAIGADFYVMAIGRLLFGVGSETLSVAILVALAQWFT